LQNINIFISSIICLFLLGDKKVNSIIKLIKILIFFMILEIIFTALKISGLFTRFDVKDEIDKKCIIESLICESVISVSIIFYYVLFLYFLKSYKICLTSFHIFLVNFK